MKTDIRKKVSKIESEIQELKAKRISVMVKEADSVLEKLLKEHGAVEVRLIKTPHESEEIEFEAAPGIRFKQAGRTFRFTRFGIVNRVVHAKVQEIIASGENERFISEGDWTPLYMLKKDEDVDGASLHIDETVEWLACSDYAWKNNVYIPDMLADNDCDPFDMPYEDVSTIYDNHSHVEEPVEKTEEREMDAEALVAELESLSTQKENLISEFNRLVWAYGVPAVIAKMKELSKETVYLRAAEDEGFFSTEDLWGRFNGGYFAVRKLKLNEDSNLSVVYNTLWNNEESYESRWGYGNENMEATVDEEISNAILPAIINVLLTDDEVYDVIDEYDDVEVQDIIDENEDNQVEENIDELNEEFQENIDEYEDTDQDEASRFKEFNGKKDMSGALSHLSKLKYIDLRGWDTSHATDMSYFFFSCENLKKVDVSVLNTRNCANFANMFNGCKNLQEIQFGSFNTSKATTMESMFSGCTSLVNLDLSSFDTSKTTTMDSMFFSCGSLVDLDLSSFNTECCTNMSCLLIDCTGLNVLNLSNWKLKSRQVITSGMFSGCNKLSRIILRNSDSETLDVIKSALTDDGIENVEIITD